MNLTLNCVVTIKRKGGVSEDDTGWVRYNGRELKRFMKNIDLKFTFPPIAS